MKKILIVFSSLFAFACNEKKDGAFTVEGQLKNAAAKTVYLELNSSESRPITVDSAQLGEGGRFSLTGSAPEESLFSIRTDVSPYPFAVLINDAKKITIEADLANLNQSYTVKGSEASQSILEFERKVNDHAQKIYNSKKILDSLNGVSVTDSALMRSKDSLSGQLYAGYENTAREMKSTAVQAIEKSKSPMFVLYALGSYQVRSRQVGESGLTQPEVADLLNKASSKFPDHAALGEQKKKLGSSKAPEFSLPDTSGKAVALSSFRGKYVLVDFWASWCKPCRMENPNIVAAFQEFKDRNFTILGVSLDKDRAAWMQAIKADGLTWTHISDLQHWNSAAAQLYGVNSIPFNVLVDPEGNIIAQSLHGPELASTLRRVLK